jgi:hypothetical protein
MISTVTRLQAGRSRVSNLGKGKDFLNFPQYSDRGGRSKVAETLGLPLNPA